MRLLLAMILGSMLFLPGCDCAYQPSLKESKWWPIVLATGEVGDKRLDVTFAFSPPVDKARLNWSGEIDLQMVGEKKPVTIKLMDYIDAGKAGQELYLHLEKIANAKLMEERRRLMISDVRSPPSCRGAHRPHGQPLVIEFTSMRFALDCYNLSPSAIARKEKVIAVTKL